MSPAQVCSGRGLDLTAVGGTPARAHLSLYAGAFLCTATLVALDWKETVNNNRPIQTNSKIYKNDKIPR